MVGILTFYLAFLRWAPAYSLQFKFLRSKRYAGYEELRNFMAIRSKMATMYQCAEFCLRFDKLFCTAVSFSTNNKECFIYKYTLYKNPGF